MKNYTTKIVLLIGAVTAAGLTTLTAQTQNRAGATTVITPPAVHDGSNASRAPFIAARPMDDVQRPNGQAIDQNVPPNTPSTNPDPDGVPAAKVAVMQPRNQDRDAALLPTGRATTGAAASLEASRLAPTLQATTFESREQVLADLDTRVHTSQTALHDFRSSTSQMSAEGKTQFEAANADVKAKEKALNKSIKAARNATSANWDTTRAQLAADYQAYADCLQRIDTAAGIAPSMR